MLVGFSTVLVSATIGIVVGFLAAYRRGWVDETLMRLVDVLMAFPGVLLAIAFVAILGPGLNHVVLALCLIGWTGYARLVRGQVLSLREREFVLAAQALGATSGRILAGHILPNLAAPLLIQCTFGMAGAIVAEGALSFLGLGVVPPTPSWGGMLNEGRQFLLVAPHLTTFPGLAILVTVLALNWIGDGLRDLFDRK
jgi:peptide/nickel transport system permease protein